MSSLYQRLNQRIFESDSHVCVGLDPVIDRLPNGVSKDLNGIEQFCFNIIDKTASHAAAFKINTAFFEAYGGDGWSVMRRIFAHIPKSILRIADAKRGDIGNTAQRYAVSLFDDLGADAVTLSPYMGRDSLTPFFERNDRGGIILCLTSNSGAADLQLQTLRSGERVFESVAYMIATLHADFGNCLAVVGATRGADIKAARNAMPGVFFLVPGVGAQGGDVKSVVRYAGADVLINASRSIIYASSQSDYAQQAAIAADALKHDIEEALHNELR